MNWGEWSSGGPILGFLVARTNAAAGAPGLQDIRGPIDLSMVSGWLIRSLLVAIPLGLLAFAWWRRRSRVAQAPERIRETAAARARARLSASWGYLEQPERFCTLLSEIIRIYLEERLGLRAPDRTTEEFLGDLQGSIALDQGHKRLLEEFLTQCDLAKFAKGDPGREELERLHQLASRLVEDTGVETEPRPGQAGRGRGAP